MGRRRESLYAVIMEGVRNQLNDDELHQHIEEMSGNVTNKRMVKALLLGFYDHDLRDPHLIHRIAVLAAKYRSNDVVPSSPSQDGGVSHRPEASVEQDNQPMTVVTEQAPVCGTEVAAETSETAEPEAVAVAAPSRKLSRTGGPRVARAKPRQTGNPS